MDDANLLEACGGVCAVSRECILTLLVAIFLFATDIKANPTPYKTLKEAQSARAAIENGGFQPAARPAVETAIFLVEDWYFVTEQSAARKSDRLKELMKKSSTRDAIRVANVTARRFSNALNFMEMFARSPHGPNEWGNTAYAKLRQTNIEDVFNLIDVALALEIPEMLNQCLEIHSRFSQALVRSHDTARFESFVRKLQQDFPQSVTRAAKLANLSDWSRIASKVGTFHFDSFVTAIDVDPRDNRVAFGLKDGSVEVWRNWTGKEPRLVSRFKVAGEVSALSFCPKEDCLITASGKLAQVWKLGRLIDDIFAFRAAQPITAIAQRPQGDYVAFAKADGWVSLFAIKNHMPTPYKELNQGFYVTSVAFNTNGVFLATGGGNESVKLWELDNLDKPINTYIHGAGVSSLAFSDDSQWLVTGSGNNKAQIWKVEEHFNSQIHLLLTHNAPVESVAFSPNGDFVATGTASEPPLLWSTVTAKRPKPIVISNATSSSFVRFSRDARFLLTALKRNAFAVLALPDLERIDLVSAHIIRFVFHDRINNKKVLTPALQDLLERNAYALGLLFP